MTRLLFIALITIMGFSTAEAQSWRKHVKLAEKLSENGKFLEAGEHYLSAWKQKQKKKELAYLAGQNFMRVKDYRKAVDALRHVKDEGKKYPMIGLDYARALKQNGQYDDASREFVYFISGYSGENATAMNSLVQNEIRGCELAIKASENKDKSPYEFTYLSPQINSSEIEYAPIAYSDAILYYSSTVTGVSKIYKSQKTNGIWNAPSPAKIGKKIEKKHFGNGSFTPDGKRFYFTQCDGVEGHFSRCEIYVIKNRNDRWTKPQRLPDYVNEEGYTATHPFVVVDGNKEILYFASDRQGGKGGMDLWYVERKLKSPTMDYSFPKNLGGRINTFGDEVSPFYRDGTLYYSSSGQVTYGGLDIFKSEGNRNIWRRPENIGQPFNSNADDWFFTLIPGQEDAGFLASNRLYGTEKITTTNEDLFAFHVPKRNIVARGKIQEEDGRSIRNAKVTLYEILKNGQKRLLHTANFPKGEYEFTLIPGKKYRVEAKKSGFDTYSYEFDTNRGNKSNYGESIALEASAPASSKPNISDVASSNNKVLPPSSPKPKAGTATNTKTTSSNSYKPVVETRKTNPPVTYKKPSAKTTKTYKAPTKTSSTNTSGTYPTNRNTVTYTVPKKTVVTPTKRYTKPSPSINTYSKDVSTYGSFYAVQVDAPLDNELVESKYDSLKDLGKVQYQYMPAQRIYRIVITEFYSKADAKRVMRQAHRRGFKRAFLAHYNNGNRKYLGR